MKNICISGDLNTHKTIVSSIVCRRLNMKYFSIMNYIYEDAEEKGFKTNEFVEILAGSEGQLNYDRKMLSLRDKEGYVVDSRLGWFAVPDSFKVFLKKGKGKEEIKEVELDSKLEEYKDYIETCHMYNIIEDKMLYGLDYSLMSNYDYIVEVGDKTEEEVADMICLAYEVFQNRKKLRIHFNNLYPCEKLDVKSFVILDRNHCISEDNVKVVQKDGKYFIVEGLFGAISQGMKFENVLCEVVEGEDDKLYECVKNGENLLKEKYDKVWENMFRIKYRLV